MSEVSFDNVSWYVFGGVSKDDEEYYLFDEDVRKKYYAFFERTVSYINTNAKIDFTESWEYKNFQEIKIGCCKFSGTDLSFNDMSHHLYAAYCDLDNTGLKIVDNKSLKIHRSTLDGLDLSCFTIDALDFFNDNAIFDSYCTFRNTGLRITNLSRDLGDSILADFKQIREKGSLDGCFINGHYIHSEDAKKEIAFRKRKEYEKYKTLLMGNILKDIKDQVAILEKKKK